MGMVIRQARNTCGLFLTLAVIAGIYSWNAQLERVELYRSGLDPKELPRISRALNENA